MEALEYFEMQCVEDMTFHLECFEKFDFNLCSLPNLSLPNTNCLVTGCILFFPHPQRVMWWVQDTSQEISFQ